MTDHLTASADMTPTVGEGRHLPECWYYDPDKIPGAAINDGWPCICYLLRACEKRVLDAAREAIRNREDGEYFPWVQVEIALAAIDALREECPND